MADGGTCDGRGRATPVAAEALGLAAAPAFALMAMIDALSGADPAGAICAAAGGSQLGGMTAMYALMSLFHLAPWLRLAAGRAN